ncbi:MAG: MATE family efflux transporter [Desulfobulbaceae bacterium]|nr:MATE family efflux transporter [Desulfobulbaceae bacterium]
MNKRFDPVTGKIFPVFFHYAVPSVIGMIAMSCAVIIDGFFIGNFGGVKALAAVNLTIPVFGLLFGIAMMLSVGGAAQCGKYLGAGNRKAANGIFSQTLIIIGVTALTATFLGIAFLDRLVLLLGASAVLSRTVAEYLYILLLFNISQMGMVCLAYFLRVDSHPFLTALSITLGCLLNVVLDWIFIAELHMGHKGAALGTGLSELATFLFLAAPFLLNKTRLKFDWQQKKLSGAFKTTLNGVSEFSNEISAGVLILIFNWLIMREFGENGVAAFSIINYIVLCGLLISCGISESLQPVVSKNFGALNHKRITSFLLISSVAVFVLGILVSVLLFVSPGTLIRLFIKTSEKETINYTIHFISKIWPVFLLNGLNIILSSYLTAMHRALSSTVIALSRGLVLPVFFLISIRILTSYEGILIVLPLSEVTTLLIALFLLKRNSPAKLIKRQRLILRRRQMVNNQVA